MAQLDPRQALSPDLLTVARALAAALGGAEPTAVSATLATVGDWEALAPEMARHGLSPLAYLSFRALGDAPESIPSAVWQSWREVLRATAAQQFFMEEYLEELVAASGLPAERLLLLKGFWLGRTVYPDPGARPLTDVDFLVRREDLAPVLGALRRLGYTPWQQIPPEREIAYWEWRARHLSRADPGCWVRRQDWRVADFDVHTHLWPLEKMLAWTPPRPDPWAGAGRLRVGDREFATPDPMTAFLQLCLHQFTDTLRQRRRLLADFDLLLVRESQGEEWDWDRVAALARRYEIAPAVHLAGRRLQELLGVPVPEEFLRATRLTPGTRGSLGIVRRLWLPRGHHFALAQLCLIQSPRERLRQATLGAWHTAPVLVRSLAEKAGLVWGGERMPPAELAR